MLSFSCIGCMCEFVTGSSNACRRSYQGGTVVIKGISKRKSPKIFTIIALQPVKCECYKLSITSTCIDYNVHYLSEIFPCALARCVYCTICAMFCTFTTLAPAVTGIICVLVHLHNAMRVLQISLRPRHPLL